MSFKDVWTYDGKAWDRTKAEGNLIIHAGARYFAAVNSEYTVVPHLVVVLSKYEYGNYMWSTSTSSAELTSTNKINFLAIDVGSGLHWRPGSRVFVILDFGLMRRHWKEETVLAGSSPPTDEDEITRLALPYFKVGFEGHVLSWMDVRSRMSSSSVTD